MDVRKIALLVGALIIAGVTAFMARNMFLGASAPEAQASAVTQQAASQVMVATRTLPVGTIIDAEMLRYQPWPEGLVQEAYFVRGQEGAADPSELIGTVVRTEVSAGQPITRGSLVRPGERGFLAAALGPGMRAVSVPVSATSGVAGFVFPGDRVDIVLTQEVEGGGDGAPLRASETIFRNVRVLAVDQRLDARNDEGDSVAQPGSNVTLEATPRMAERIAVAQTLGQLSLSLRSLADNNAELERAIASGDVQVPQNGDPNAERQMLLAVANRPIDGGTTYSVGADVSRFQRSTVPGRSRENNSAPAASGGSTPVTPDGRPAGPVVRIARGNNVTLVPVGAR
jgi:pilus assembly protein CpaB